MKNFSPVQFRQSGQRQSFSQQHEQQPTTKKVYAMSSFQSPYNFSPNKITYSMAASTDELELYKQRCWDLEKQLLSIKSEAQLQKEVNMKADELQFKVKEVVEQNKVLQSQLDKAAKQLLQKKNESEIWKQKFDGQVTQLTQIKGSYEMEIKQLASELQLISSKISSAELDKNRNISDARAIHEAQSQFNIDHIQKSQFLQNDLYEVQVKKMRDIIEDKTVQVTQLQTLLERYKAEAQDQQYRMRNEVESVKNRMSSLKIDHQNEMEILRNKLELTKENQFRNAQQAHSNQADIQQSENDNLKNLLDIKDSEIETLLTQNQKQKLNFDNENNFLRLEIQDLRLKLHENEATHQFENNHIQTNLETMHNVEVTSMKINNNQWHTTLTQEIHQLKDIIYSKNNEIEKQLIEKTQQKDFYDKEVWGLMHTIEDWKRKFSVQEAERNKQTSDLMIRIDRLNQNYNDQCLEWKNQNQVSENKVQNMVDLILHKNQEIEINMKNISQMKLDFETYILSHQQEQQLTKLTSQENQKLNLQQIDDLKMLLREQEQTYKERFKALEIIIEHLKYDIGKVSEMFNNKLQECENLVQQKQHFQNQQIKYQDTNDELMNKLNEFDRIKNIEMDELRERMDSQASYQFDNLKKAYNTQVNILSQQISDDQIQLQNTHKEYAELLSKYSILDRSIHTDEMMGKSIYNSRAGQTGEYISNKAIHDVIIKSSVRSNSLNRF